MDKLKLSIEVIARIQTLLITFINLMKSIIKLINRWSINDTTLCNNIDKTEKMKEIQHLIEEYSKPIHLLLN